MMSTTDSPKLFPWFVSDVTPLDFEDLLQCLLSPFFFPTIDPDPVSVDGKAYLRTMVTRWKSYITSGVFELSVPADTQLGSKNVMADFWTEPWPYWNMKERSGELFASLMQSSLVVFKVSHGFDPLAQAATM